MMKARHRLTRRHQHDGKQGGVEKIAEFIIDSDTFMFVHTPAEYYHNEPLLFWGPEVILPVVLALFLKPI